MVRRRLVLAGLALLLAGTRARAEECGPRWHTSLAAGKEAAKAEGRLLFVYLDPSWQEGHAVQAEGTLSETALEAAADRLVVVRLTADVEDPESEAVRTRYSLWDQVPAGVVIDADGASFGTLYGGDTDTMLRLLRDAKEHAAKYSVWVAALVGSTLPDGLRSLATLYYGHCAFEEAIQVVQTLAETTTLTADDLAWYAYALAKVGRLEDAAAAYERLVKEHPEHPQLINARIALATMHLPPSRIAMLRLGREDPQLRQAGFDALQPLLEAVREEGDVAAEAAVRFLLLNFQDQYAEYVAQCTWIVENAPQSPPAMVARERLVQMAAQWNDLALAKRYAEELLEAESGDETIRARVRDEVLPWIEAALPAFEDPDRRPFDLGIEVPEGPVEPGTTVTARVHLVNRSDRSFGRVALVCYPAGPVQLTGEALVDAGRLAPLATTDLDFELQTLRPGTAYLVVAVQRADVLEEGARLARHVRFEISR